MIRFFILIAIFDNASGDNYADVTSNKWSVLEQFDKTYLRTIKEEHLRLTGINRDFENEFAAAKENGELINFIDLKNDANYFLKSWFNEQKADIQKLADIYVKYLAMWASLTFKVCFLWESNHPPVDSNKVASCEKASFYMRWFHSTYFDKMNNEFESLLYDGTPQVWTEDRNSDDFSFEKISDKLAYINIVTTEISNLFDVTYMNIYHPVTPQNQDWLNAKKKLEENFPDIYSIYSVDRDSRVKIFWGKTYAEIWLNLLNVYGQNLIDVENYFNSMLGENRKIISNVELIPTFIISDIWDYAQTFSDFLSSNEEDNNHKNKGGKILMQMEKIKEIGLKKLTSITIREITAEPVFNSETPNFLITSVEDSNSKSKVIPLNEIMISIFANPTPSNKPETGLTST